jgi:hypothetical protein
LNFSLRTLLVITTWGVASKTFSNLYFPPPLKWASDGVQDENSTLAILWQPRDWLLSQGMGLPNAFPSCIFAKLRWCCILTWTSSALACGPSVVTEVWGFFTACSIVSRCPSHFSGQSIGLHFPIMCRLCKPNLWRAQWLFWCPGPNLDSAQRYSIWRARLSFWPLCWS